MPDAATDFGPSLRDLSKPEWIAEVGDIVDARGWIRPLGARHLATFIEDNSTLLVTFETLQGIQALSPLGHPLGWDLVRDQRWSHLAVMSDGDTWFRDAKVYELFDRLVDEGFFDGFDRVLFFGAGPGGYAAAAFSVAAPGARVLAIQPQATLDPAMTEWDNRFTHMRRTCFTDRYGYAPDMTEACERAFILFDPRVAEDAMHAALFSTPAVTRLRMPNMGAALQTDLLQMGLLTDLIELAGKGMLTPRVFHAMARARRDHLPYLRRLLSRLDADDREPLARRLCANVAARLHAPRFARRLEALHDPAAE
ncbi:phosphoadenosine phosphosulfate reductase [Roseobacter ponti]|uniref:Phosphoadenosine phosphosulfate reductase n=1 Tax=Roseobacter ponti TaxID=1891787 RepID=A0A858ST68_9RHOB|nr:phosphoadenosine phosphosulfate reductase [Roseobacter ponti]QJF50903.1 phosphoadenosine phosphosulfate reductase [Roseobacter ponti]